jgi:penicillin-binding protein 2
MMLSQAGTGSGAGGDAVRKIYETLYNIKSAPPAGQEPKG